MRIVERKGERGGGGIVDPIKQCAMHNVRVLVADPFQGDEIPCVLGVPCVQGVAFRGVSVVPLEGASPQNDRY